MVHVRSIVARLRPLLRRPVALDGLKGKRSAIGDFGERLAVETIWAQGGKVLYRNFRSREGGEVDVVAREGRVLCFIEVKTRTSRRGRPIEAVDSPKQKLIERGGRAWLALLGRPEIPCRYDVVEVILEDGQVPEVTWVKDAF